MEKSKIFQLTIPYRLRLNIATAIVVLTIFLYCTYASPPLDGRDVSDQNPGLYNASDKVNTLTDATFNQNILHKNHSAFLQFYNFYCGHCRRFAPYYKKFAEDLYPWRDVLPLWAIDCSVEQNNKVCREFEVMAYPTLRYIPPNFEPKEGNYGVPIMTQDLDEIRTILATMLAAENVTKTMITWPNLKNMTAKEIAKPLEDADGHIELVIAVYEPENTTIGIETALRFQRWPAVQIRRVTDADVAAKLNLIGNHKIASISRNGDITTYEASAESVSAYAEVIEKILEEYQYAERPENSIINNEVSHLPQRENGEIDEKSKILDEVKRNKHMVYQADLEMAIRKVLFSEIPRKSNISGESLLALQRFFAVLKNYSPFGANLRMVINKMHEVLIQTPDQIGGKEFEEELKRYEKLYAPLFSSNQFVGCSSSAGTNFRGYTCSLWQLFHFMTVQAATNDLSNDPLEVLQAMHGYVKHFFGCTDCSEHFQGMASKRKMWNVANKDEAVLWLWSAHNEVNKRLAGDAMTEDPLFPKIQFPSRSSCPKCYKDSQQQQQHTSESLKEIKWNKDAVLSFLKNIHNPQFVSRYGIKHEEVLRPSLEKLRSKRMVSNIFTDMDMRMGMLLYGFCIVMMVVAFKLFVYKGYRKKPYCHDILGKV